MKVGKNFTSQLSMFGFENIGGVGGEQKHKRMVGEVLDISHETASDFLIQRHYSGRVPSISRAFGWFVNGELKAVCTFGKPASPTICENVCGNEYSQSVYELNRLCREQDFKEPLSAFVGACLRRLRINRWIIVSYSEYGNEASWIHLPSLQFSVHRPNKGKTRCICWRREA